ncbi:hypothetical protein [Agitococcus lubricus]|uniref:Glucosamine inositolphosphorylceramide transferase 1 N-terminal domain-containing protein n=1 Tax=Agitococcus lubricus TaxID=1077255 RepID=A0A2T5J0V9_9GAMM|nr:hypothetical protein [Agitococcus lubricus]PTQ90025.1 hypothetical protein C8N29_10463 [Agitococcus lubricus]
MNFRRYLAKKYYASQVRREEKTHLGQWMILYRQQDSALSADLQQMHQIIPPTDRFYADPFVASENGRTFIFIEEYPFATPIGFISVIEVLADGRHSDAVPIIQCPYHLSYPLLFKHEGQWFMLPETHQNKTIEVWRCEEFPYKWQKHSVLIDNIVAADTTPVFHDQRWWLLTALKQDCKKFGDKLFIFSGTDILGKNWQAHSQNPVKQSLVFDRPAGNIIQHNGQLIRPVQDSVTRYGGALELRTIQQLTTSHYQEQLLQRIEPCWDDSIKGTHTYNYADGWLVMDGLKVIPKPS